MNTDRINGDLSCAYVKAVQALQDPKPKARQSNVSCVSLVSLETGLCALGSPQNETVGWRVIKKEDLTQLMKCEDGNTYRDTIVRVAEAMATCPPLAQCGISVPVDGFAEVIETFWKLNPDHAKLQEARVIAMLSSKEHPELKTDPTSVTVILEARPDFEEQNSKAIRSFLGDVYIAGSLLAKRDEVEAQNDLKGLSDSDLAMKLYFYNFAPDFSVKRHDLSGLVLVKDLRKDATAEIECTILPDSIRKELVKRVPRADFLETVEPILSILPCGNYILDVIKEVDNTEKALQKIDALTLN